jgi:hypothetical protein
MLFREAKPSGYPAEGRAIREAAFRRSRPSGRRPAIREAALPTKSSFRPKAGPLAQPANPDRKTQRAEAEENSARQQHLA